MSPADLIRIRRDEQREAAHRAGAKDVYFLDNVDGELAATRDFLGEVVRHIRMLKPYAVFTHDPEAFIVRNSFINHSDHRTTGHIAMDAIYPSARDRLNFPEHIADGLETHNVKEIFIWGSEKANFDVDISDVVDQKIHALNAHVSQGLGAENADSDFLKFVRERWRGRGRTLHGALPARRPVPIVTVFVGVSWRVRSFAADRLSDRRVLTSAAAGRRIGVVVLRIAGMCAIALVIACAFFTPTASAQTNDLLISPATGAAGSRFQVVARAAGRPARA